ncbi:GDSL-type esterase/lipase family protein [Aurantiacibacter poecillastricola]|uniref:GDSL-type esterase/lipase family protein n=1 Tax=Aurantiacibacter poecillastricola TaxID=3064385 RepID=UPI00273F9AE7|nr:GDSL-type esterase/lipase family protein [Aurantiacibacter sp. 219JJ12-13]MDP5263025.1 GDSL-type esterase/lipase family protein [Aurantiacibacter sp. 219JJ12-13]
MRAILVPLAGSLMLVSAVGQAHAEVHGNADSVPMGREFAAVNGTVIQCPLPAPREAEAMAAQFETRPRDLDRLAEEAAAFFESDSEIGAAFRARRAEQFATDWPQRCRYRDANADLVQSGRDARVVFMGDSITEGWVEADPEYFSANGYVGRGISGQSSPQMLARFWQDVVALDPDAVHIMAGTNDIGGATGPITEVEYIGTIRSMIDIAKANDITVILAGLPPMSRLLPRLEFDTRPVVPRLNTLLAELARDEGIIFVDYFTSLSAPDDSFDIAYANDGVHPTRAGYAVMKELAEKAIAQALEPDKE